MLHIGKKIKQLREWKNYTQEYMAEKLNISQSSYSKIEADEVKIDLEKAEAISEILGITLNQLISFDEKNIFYNSTQKGDNVNYNMSSFKAEKELYERLIFEKDEVIKALKEEIEILKNK